MTCWIYDLDGVVTSLTEKKITNPKLLEYFTKQLQKQEPVTINTGRSLPFIRQEIIAPLLNHLNQQQLPESLLHNFYAVGEKGSVWIEDEKENFDMSTAVPEDFAKKVQTLVEKDFADSMSFDPTKTTMISIELATGMTIAEFTPAKERLLPILEDMVKEAHLEKDFTLDISASALDIQAKNAGKAKGADHILDWLKKRAIEPDECIVFGDSVADIGTGEALQNANKNFTFVFVGNPHILISQPLFPITFTKEKYDSGVIEYLEAK